VIADFSVAKATAIISCPDKDGKIQGEPMWKEVVPLHFIGKVCKKCGKPVAEHGFRIGGAK
jgi:hypothetical protein